MKNLARASKFKHGEYSRLSLLGGGDGSLSNILGAFSRI